MKHWAGTRSRHAWVTSRLDLKTGTVLPHYKLVILIILIALGAFLQLSGLIDYEQLITLARKYADYWWLAVLLV